ncbi:hypothetical protein DK26_15275 [Bosea sp. WAO]|uniref:hypothetical protein n=1 Tax=Bosea sp. WAO TaxID=406341 RepID=UPI000746123A|nr:hypothetical protein [Bosea sp. WAO]KUL94366.1 hypothetical protein DK26_15275 [Bosea sp. WAO]
MAEKLTKADALELMRQAVKATEGGGHSIHFGDPPRYRYDPNTGEPYLTDPTPARLECSPAKMRAIWSLWEKLPQIVAALENTDDR